MSRFPSSMRMVGLEPGFTRSQWDIVMSIPRPAHIRKLAYQEWLDEQAPEYENSPLRWYLSYLHGSGTIPLYRPISPITPIEQSRIDNLRDEMSRTPPPPPTP